MKLENLLEVLQDFDQNKYWNPNMQEGKEVLQIADDCFFRYMKTKKVAMVSSRDQYSVIFKRMTEDKGKHRKLYIASKSKDLANYPPTQGAVRSEVILSGFIFDEIGSNCIDCHFYAETDPKISLFICR